MCSSSRKDILLSIIRDLESLASKGGMHPATFRFFASSMFFKTSTAIVNRDDEVPPNLDAPVQERGISGM